MPPPAPMPALAAVESPGLGTVVTVGVGEGLDWEPVKLVTDVTEVDVDDEVVEVEVAVVDVVGGAVVEVRWVDESAAARPPVNSGDTVAPPYVSTATPWVAVGLQPH